MSNKELRKALLIRYKVFLKRRWYYVLLCMFYVALGILSEFEYIEDKEVSYMIFLAVFAMLGLIAMFVLEITRHEKCIYMIPLSYEERKRYYFIGVLINFTMVFSLCITFVVISAIINAEYGQYVLNLFALFGLPYTLVVSFQKINMFKGKKKKDNPKMVYVSGVIGGVVGVMIVALIAQFEELIKNPKYLCIGIIVVNVGALGRVIWAIIDIIKHDTDYENVKINQIKAMKKLM
ncbi:hypothetical protein [Anaerosporobacter sp.]|uniref:hypothetical protein n=1 Tax=Anaerosporobacter sp. TaxID=1872529 RepID=UPI00286F30AB|nr:hypothetical protein [Anaerosporobacter sp.]